MKLYHCDPMGEMASYVMQEDAGNRSHAFWCLATYIKRKLKQTHPTMRISPLALQEMDHFMKDVLERIGQASEELLTASHTKTLTPFCLAKAVKLVMPPRLALKCRLKGRDAIYSYHSSFQEGRRTC